MAIDLVTAGGWLFSVVTAVVAYKAATRTYSQTTKDADKSVYVSAVTTERAKWREDFRSNVADFVKASWQANVDLPELRRLKAEILLRLNPRSLDPGMHEKHKYDFAIIKSIEAIFSHFSGGPTAEIPTTLAILERNAQELLKQEWEKSKAEALAGTGRTPPAA